MDGPRILGVQNIDRSAATVRLQVRTAPTRQDEVARELRRRIQLEFQKQGIPLSSVHRFEFASDTAVPHGVPRTEFNGPGSDSALFSSSEASVAEPSETKT